MKPTVLDLFCGAGGAGEGYRRAGFEVVGVDIEHHNYPCGTFEQADAMDVLRAVVAGGHNVDVIHLSPPCQAFTNAQRIQGNTHPDYISACRPLLAEWVDGGGVYVMENVVGAPLIDPMMLCGAMFGLRTYRHRLFESNVLLETPSHPEHVAKNAKMGRPVKDGEFMHIVGNYSGVALAREIMDTPWMTRNEMSEAIPPAYTEYIGRQIMEKVFA